MPAITSRLSTALADRYKIERHLGEGGMATVYLAHDLKHDRKVAVKVLRPELAAVLGAERFVQEIKTTANLQHPHILPLFDSGEADSFLYYVMPFIDGETLRDKLNRETQLGIDEAVNITTAIADALDYAHRNNVIHRDIKPENILLHDGRPMVADFGIALALSAAAGGRMTETGMSLGTPHYMSPEQATAEKDLTNRSDIYSLGCVLYEMLTGEPPHTGGSAQAIIMKIVTDEARPVTELRKSVPSHVAAATAKSLEKLAADRFESAAKFAEALTNPAFTLPTTQAAGVAARPEPRTVMQWLPWGLATVAVGAALVGWFTRGEPTSMRVTRFYATPVSGERFESAIGTSLVLSPDGTRLVYLARSESGEVHLYLRELDQLDGTPIPGTMNASMPFFSPDGKWLGFLADQRLRKVSLAGGPPITITPVPGDMRGVSWGPDGFIVFAPATGSGLFRVSDIGGEPEALTETVPDSGDHRWPFALPTGKGALFTIFPGLPEAEIAVVSYETGHVARLVDGTNPLYVDGYLVFGQAEGATGALFAAPFDADKLEVTGPPVPLLEGVVIKGGGAGEYSVSTNGSFVYVSGTASDQTPVLVGRDGTERALDVPAGDYHMPRFSPDGRSFALSNGSGSVHDIWTYEIARGAFARLTFEGTNWDLLWTVDGRRIIYLSSSGLLSRAADGSGGIDQLSSARLRPMSWGPEARSIVMYANSGDIWVVPLEGQDSAFALLDNPYLEVWPSLSPDGRFLAYGSNESGANQIYVEEFPGLGGRRQVSTGGGREPLWSRDGTELFYRSPEGFVSVPIDLTSGFDMGEPAVLFDDQYLNDVTQAYDVHPDGDHFVFIKQVASSTQIVVVLNWLEELKERMGN